ncbi:hypothetical protein Tco_0635059 [Tanacetum coccineum]
MKRFPSDMSLGIVAGDCMVFADKSWLEKPRGSQEFYDGVQKFVAHCTPLVNSAGKIRCPCKRCRNILFKPIEWIGDHITDNGWDPLYTVWDKHGEPAPPTPPPQATPTPPPLMSDMTSLLDDLSYIPPNNEHNEPTQEDIGETSNEPTQATRNEFEELYSSANEALYPGCDHVTRLDFMAKFTYFKVKGKLTDSIFNEMLEWLQYALPESKGYKFPPSYYAIKKTFKTIGLGYESIHACEHDCCLFRGEVNKDLQFCPVCNTSRWKDSDTPGKKVPRKVLRYFPIIPRLQRLYKSRHTAKDMIWHATGKCTEPGKMQHPVDGGAWKKFDMKYPDFAKEPRNVRLGLCADGFNPFGNLSQTYNMWPVILTTYNLPPWLCMKESNFMLTLLIPGPKSPGKDIDVYEALIGTEVLWDRRVHCEFNGDTDHRDPPKEYPRDVILAQHARLLTRVPALEALERAAYSPGGCLLFETIHEELKGYVRNKLQPKVPEIEHRTGPSSRVYFQKKNMLEEFTSWFRTLICERHTNNLQDPEVSTTSELFALANGPSRTPMSVNACVVDGVRGVIVVENEPDIIHLDNSSDLPPSTSGNDLDNVTFYIDLHIDGESTEVDAPPDIIDVPGEDDDISDDEDPLPHDLADSDVEDLINDDDGVEKVYSSEEED